MPQDKWLGSSIALNTQITKIEHLTCFQPHQNQEREKATITSHAQAKLKTLTAQQQKALSETIPTQV